MTVHIAREGGVATVTVDRTEGLNALDPETTGALGSVVDKLSRDGETRVVILTGAGPKAFIAGADIKAIRDCTPEEARRISHAGSGVCSAIEAAPQPWIAAVNGYCLGAGLELALACDVRLASHGAVFGLPEVGLGIMPGTGGTQRLWREVGLGWAKYLALSARRISADEALSIGLVQGVHAGEELMPKAFELALTFASNPPLSLRYCKTALRGAAELGIEAGAEYERSFFALCFATEDQKEGMAAFVEKRAPRFVGR